MFFFCSENNTCSRSGVNINNNICKPSKVHDSPSSVCNSENVLILLPLRQCVARSGIFLLVHDRIGLFNPGVKSGLAISGVSGPGMWLSGDVGSCFADFLALPQSGGVV